MTKKEKKEILRLLKIVRKYAEKTRANRRIDTRIAYIDQYIREYSKEEVLITQSTFVKCNETRIDAPDETSTVRNYFKINFRPFLKNFFEGEGKNLPFRLEIPSGQFYLLLVPNKAVSSEAEDRIKELLDTSNEEGSHIKEPIIDSEDSVPDSESKPPPKENPQEVARHISFTEQEYLAVRHRPFLYSLGVSIFLPVAILLLLVGFLMILKNKDHLSFYSWSMLTIASIVVVWRGFAFAVLPERKFVWFVGRCFLRLHNLSLTIASYSGICLICGGVVRVVHKRIRRKEYKGYIAECQNNPEVHIYSFDPALLTGELLIKD